MTWKGNGKVNAIDISKNGSRIASGSGKFVRVLNASTGEVLKILKGHTDDVTSVTFSADSSRVVSGSRDRMVRVQRYLYILYKQML